MHLFPERKDTTPIPETIFLVNCVQTRAKKKHQIQAQEDRAKPKRGEIAYLLGAN
jgi:hypothetical protein